MEVWIVEVLEAQVPSFVTASILAAIVIARNRMTTAADCLGSRDSYLKVDTLRHVHRCDVLCGVAKDASLMHAGAVREAGRGGGGTTEADTVCRVEENLKRRCGWRSDVGSKTPSVEALAGDERAVEYVMFATRNCEFNPGGIAEG